MSGLKKPKTTGTPAPKSAVSAPIPDEIDQIMNEIEELQQEMNAGAETAAKGSAAGRLKVVASATDEADAAEASESDDNLLSEFRAAGGGEASLEDTLADLRDDGESSGNGLLDQVIEESEIESHDASHETADAEESSPETSAETSADEYTDEAHDEASADGDALSMSDEEYQNTIHGEQAMHDDNNANEGTLTMTLSGNMTLKLKYEINGQEVTVGFADNCLKVQLADGTEFKVPVARAVKKGSRRAA